MSDEVPINFRKAGSRDMPFIFSAWLKSFRDSSFARGISNSIFYKEHHQVIERICGHSDVLLAVNPDDPDQIYGFICFESEWDMTIIHYVYVKECYRGFGLARKLFESVDPKQEKPFIYTHDTCLGKKIGDRGIYSPYIIFHRPGEAV